MSSPRQLAYRDRFVWELEQVVSSIFDDCNGFENFYVFPDMTTRVPFVMYLSQTQWTQLYSAILTGADLSYPNQSHDIENLFLQTVNCTMSELCQAIADCILNSAVTQAALAAWLSNAGFTGGVGNPEGPVSPGVLGQNLLPAGYVCSDDNAFGMSLAIVNSINDATLEVLQAIEILTNPLELANEIGDNIPGIGALTSVGDVAAWVQDSATENYVLAWSDVVRDELACLLWCQFKFNCELSFDSIWDVYMAAAAVTPPESHHLEDWLVWLIALPFTDALSTVSTISLLGLIAMRWGGTFGEFRLGIRSIETVIKLAEDESSSDWAIVCDTCVEWCHEFDFSVDDGGWALGPSWSSGVAWGVYVPGNYWESEIDVVGGIESSVCAIYINFGSTITLTEMTLEYTGADAGSWEKGVISSVFYYTTDLIARISLDSYAPATPPGSNVWSGLVSMAGVSVNQWNSYCNPGNTIGLQQLTKITLKGNGVNPFGDDNCP